MKKIDQTMPGSNSRRRTKIAARARQLTDEQAAEVERRMAEVNPTFLTLEEVRRRFALRRKAARGD